MEEQSAAPEKIDQPQKNRFNRSDLLSILAVFVSLSALGVSIYEAGILRKQSAMMQEQQKASVWPYLHLNTQYLYDQGSEIIFEYKNKGVGPAKINSFQLSINGTVFKDYSALLNFFNQSLAGATNIDISYGPLNSILSADESAKVFSIHVAGDAKNYEQLKQMDFKFEVCYCSIYDDCWFVDSTLEAPVKNCP